METKIITIANQKGGVGKTTTALCLGAALEEKGYKVLYIDLDKQCNTSKTLKADTDKKGSYEILANKLAAKEVVQQTINNQYVITANKNLNNIDLILSDSNNSLGKEYRLKESLKSINGYFDYVVIDTPPSINNATINALTCTDYLVVVANADTFSLDGIVYLLEMCNSVKEYTNKSIKVGGILLTRFNNRANINKDFKDMLDELARNNDLKIYNSIIRECIAIKESQALKEKITTYAPKSNAYIDYLAFTEEVLKDLNDKQ